MSIPALAVLISWLCISLSARGWSWHSSLHCSSTWERCAQGRAKTFSESYKTAPPPSVIPNTNTHREHSCLPSKFQFLHSFCWGIFCFHINPKVPCLCHLLSPLSSKMMGLFPVSTFHSSSVLQISAEQLLWDQLLGYTGLSVYENAIGQYTYKINLLSFKCTSLPSD